MHCERYHDNLNPLLDGEIGAEERAATIAHLQDCPTCSHQYQRLQTLRHRLLVGRVPMPRSLVYRVRAGIALEAAEQPSRRPVPAARPMQPPRTIARTDVPRPRRARATCPPTKPVAPTTRQAMSAPIGKERGCSQ